MSADPALHRGARGAARVAALVRREGDPPARARVGGGARVPARAVHADGRARLPRDLLSRGVRRPGRRHACTAPCSPRRWRAAAPAAWRPGSARHTGIAMPPILKFGTEEQKQRWIVPGDQGREDRGAGDHRAGRRLGRRGPEDVRAPRQRRVRRERLQDVHHERRARGLLRDRREDDAGGRPPRALVPRAREGHARLRGHAQAREARLARVRHRRAVVLRRARAGGEPARRGEQGLLPDHGQLPVGAARDGARRRRRHAGDVRAHARIRAGARGVRPPDRPLPGDPPQARGDGDEDRGLPRPHLPGAAPVRRRARTR